MSGVLVLVTKRHTGKILNKRFSMIIQTMLRVLELAERSSEEMAKEKDPKSAPKFVGNASIRRSKKLKSGAVMQLEDVIGFKSVERPSEGADVMVECEITAYSINGNTGLSVKVLRAIKTPKNSTSAA